MIAELASPSVCVIDDEEDEFRAILDALNKLYVSSIHILGNDVEKLPPRPFTRLQLVFLDLYLTNSLGKDAASHTANVFRHVVSADTAPVIVVIWSKHADEIASPVGVPEEDQETQSDLFKQALFEAEPRFENRLIFLEMRKPKEAEQSDDWANGLHEEIKNVLVNQPASSLLWTWDGLVKDSSAAVAASLTTLAEQAAGQGNSELTDTHLKEVLQRLAKAQGEGDISAATAPGHLAAVLAQLLMDHLEHSSIDALSTHGTWLAAQAQNAPMDGFFARMNGLLLTAVASPASAPFIPGTVYRLKEAEKFNDAFGRDLPSLLASCTSLKQTQEKWPDWLREARPILVEISPACDFAQNNRVNSLLIAGLILPASLATHRKGGDSFSGLPVLHLRWAAPDFPAQDAALACTRFG